MISLKNLETFVCVVHLGGFGHAATRMNTTQSAISQRISTLESTVGVCLIDRKSRQAVATQKGLELLLYAEQMLRLRAQMLHAISTKETLHGHIRLGVAETIAQTVVVGLIQKMQEIYPSVVVDLEVDVSTKLRDDLLRGDLDMIIPSMPLLEPNVRNHDFVRYPMAWVASPALALPEGRITLKDIAQYPVITYPKNTRPYQDIRDMFLRESVTELKMYGNTSLSAITSLCAGGIGVAVIPPIVIKNELGDGSLRLIEVDGSQLPDLQFTISYVVSVDSFLLEAITRLALEMVSA